MKKEKIAEVICSATNCFSESFITDWHYLKQWSRKTEFEPNFEAFVQRFNCRGNKDFPFVRGLQKLSDYSDIAAWHFPLFCEEMY